MEGPVRNAKTGPGRSRKVLVAEDERMIRSVVAKVLRKKGFEVVEAIDGWQAFEVLKADGGVEVLVTDLWMPRMNGCELIEAAASLPTRPAIIVMSGHVAPATAEHLGRLNVTRIVRKPADISRLVNTVNDALAERDGRTPPAGPSGGGNALPKVVVADDDIEFRRTLRVLLSCHGFDVVEAGDGEEAVNKLLETGAGLAIMDLNMPRKGGVEAVAAVRKAARDCLVVCMTGECGRREMDAALKAGAVRCFRKPLDMEALVREIKKLKAVADHRRDFAAREQVEEGPRSGILARLRARRTRCLALAGLVVTVIAGVLVPLLSRYATSAGRAAASAGTKLDATLGAASRIEAYLQRDEDRELRRR